MNENMYVKNMQARIEAIEEALAAAAGGDFTAEIPIDMEAPDVLTSVGTGINLLISDLRDEVRERQKLADELANLKGNQDSTGLKGEK